MDYYGVLGVAQNASLKEIKDAYRKQALKHHPDRFCNGTKAEQEQASLRFKAAAEAYRVLSNDANRVMYDLSGQQGRSWSDAGSDARANRNNKYHSAYNPYESYGAPRSSGFRRNRQAWKNSGFSSWSEFSYKYGRQMTFHTVASAAILGFLFLTSSSADWIWNSVNQGRSFEDFIAAREKRLEAEMEASTCAQDTNKAESNGEGTPQECQEEDTPQDAALIAKPDGWTTTSHEVAPGSQTSSTPTKPTNEAGPIEKQEH
ncbi:hypothetical protein BSKO_06600 [Bryopsis sp. KO-2023]|nr:hypothetical protein BSKO_06600 [Bryopsis sp. KO-2023]